jgi:hypothetical protein
MKRMKAIILFLLVTMLVVSSAAVAATGSTENAPPGITYLAPVLQGYDGERYTYDYSGWIAYLESKNIPNARNYLSKPYTTSSPYARIGEAFDPGNIPPPQHFLVAKYVDAQRGKSVMVEIYEYGDSAGWVYGTQTRPPYGYGGIFQRFNAQMVLLHRGPFMVFLFCTSDQPQTDTLAESTLTDFTQKYVDYLFDVIPESTRPPSPPSGDSKAIWGVRKGDTISWELNEGHYTGYSSGAYTHTKTIEIAQVTNDNSAILIKRPKSPPSDFDYITYWVHGNLDLVLPAYEYFWATDGVGDSEAPWTLIFPISSQGQTLEDKIKSMHYDVTESAENLTASISTPYEIAGVSLTETQRSQFTVHKGSGITTSASSDYYNKASSIGRSVDLTLRETNFYLSSRVPMPTIKPSAPPTTNPSALPTTKPSVPPTTKPSPTPAPSIPLMIIVIGIAAYFRLKKT